MDEQSKEMDNKALSAIILNLSHEVLHEIAQ